MASKGTLREKPRNEALVLTPVKIVGEPAARAPSAVAERPRAEIDEKGYLNALGLARKGMDRRIPWGSMNKETRETVDYLLGILKRAGVDAPAFGKDTVFATTGPNNITCINGNGEKCSFVMSGNEIFYAINDSPRERMKELLA